MMLTILTTAFFSCHRDVIDLDLDNMDRQIVIEGLVSDQPEAHTVKLSKTIEYISSRDFPVVSGAEITISDDAGNSEILSEIVPGVYQTQELIGRPGRTYYLRVLAEGKEYTASSDMPKALELDEIAFEYYDSIRFLRCYFNDREGIEDYCLLKLFKNGELIERFLYQDRYTDGQRIVIDDFDAIFSINDRVEIQFLTINKETYQYFSGWFDGDDYDPDLPEFVPVTFHNPITNLSNNALGYFGAHTLRRYNLIVE
jgi:hypothetical protein